MAEGSKITFRDLDEDEFERIRNLSNSVQEHFKNVHKQSHASAETFQIHANQAEVEKLVNEDICLTNSNNNTEQETKGVEVRNSFHSIPSDEEEQQITGSSPKGWRSRSKS